jgi:hypothetical protein
MKYSLNEFIKDASMGFIAFCFIAAMLIVCAIAQAPWPITLLLAISQAVLTGGLIKQYLTNKKNHE